MGICHLYMYLLFPYTALKRPLVFFLLYFSITPSLCLVFLKIIDRRKIVRKLFFNPIMALNQRTGYWLPWWKVKGKIQWDLSTTWYLNKLSCQRDELIVFTIISLIILWLLWNASYFSKALFKMYTEVENKAVKVRSMAFWLMRNNC